VIVVSKYDVPDGISDLAFTYWKYHANENAYQNKLITRPIYEYARDDLQKTIDLLAESRYINAGE